MVNKDFQNSQKRLKEEDEEAFPWIFLMRFSSPLKIFCWYGVRSQGCVHAPRRSWSFFQSIIGRIVGTYSDLQCTDVLCCNKQHTIKTALIFAVLNFYVFCSVEYSTGVSGIWGLHHQTPPGLCPWTPLLDFRPPSFPLSKFLAMPCLLVPF